MVYKICIYTHARYNSKWFIKSLYIVLYTHVRYNSKWFIIFYIYTCTLYWQMVYKIFIYTHVRYNRKWLIKSLYITSKFFIRPVYFRDF